LEKIREKVRWEKKRKREKREIGKREREGPLISAYKTSCKP